MDTTQLCKEAQQQLPGDPNIAVSVIHAGVKARRTYRVKLAALQDVNVVGVAARVLSRGR
mgnify:CR=1 FL=1